MRPKINEKLEDPVIFIPKKKHIYNAQSVKTKQDVAP
jgi:hypothetical protein